MSDVLFQTGKSELRAPAREKLAKIAGIVSSHPGLKLEVEGHTDSVGGDEYNQQLSEKRAQAARDYLVNQGVSSNLIVSRGFGKTKPVAPNDTSEGRRKNRRVEMVVSGEAIAYCFPSGVKGHGVCPVRNESNVLLSHASRSSARRTGNMPQVWDGLGAFGCHTRRNSQSRIERYEPALLGKRGSYDPGCPYGYGGSHPVGDP
jgi:hypothetical protein